MLQQTESLKAPSHEDPINNVLPLKKKISVLAVEDDSLAMEFLNAQISELGHQMLSATNGEEALKTLRAKKDSIDVVLMDQEMPIMDGMTAVKHMKDDPELRRIPVVMVTGADDHQEIQDGLDAGVFYYLTKPVDEGVLRSVLAAAVREAQQSRLLSEELGKHKASFELIENCKFKFQTLAEAESLAAFMANCFPDPERVLTGLGELLINAVEHGSLGVGYDLKTELIENNIWRSEIERLQSLDAHKDKYIEATIAHKDEGVYAIIQDQGQGFDWKKYMKIDPARAGDNHGRGIAQANVMSFDKLVYNEVGNQAVAFVGNEKQLEW